MGEKGTVDGRVRNAMLPHGFVQAVIDADHASNLSTGQNAFWDNESQRWTDSKTGELMDPPPREGGGSSGAR